MIENKNSGYHTSEENNELMKKDEVKLIELPVF